MKVVHSERSTCYAISGRGDSSTRIPDGGVKVNDHLPWPWSREGIGCPLMENQIAFSVPLICDGDRQNLATSGTHQEARKRRLGPALRTGGWEAAIVEAVSRV